MMVMMAHQEVVQAPALVASTGVEAVIPVGVPCYVRVLAAEGICEATAQK